MSSSSTNAAPDAPRETYLNNGYGWKSWLLTVDHKRIAILYLLGVSFFFTVGGLFAALMRIELATPRADLVDSETYNRLFTMHGIVMIFFFLIPAIPAVLGNFLVPIMVGARDLAFPKINLISWYIYMVGGLLGLTVAVLGGVDTGWTFYTPYSSTYSNSQVALTAIATFITGFSSILTGLNFIVTVHKMRAPGLTWFRLPLFIWAHYATSLIMVLATPVLATTIFLMALERIFRIGIFDPTLGGDPVLFQHMFWFYSHPAVYIMILPGMGVISEIIACFSKKRVFGYSFVAFSSLAIAVLGFMVWGHHMYTTGQSVYSSIVFSVLTMLVAVPSAVKTFNWTATLYKGTVELTAPMLFALAFIGLFVVGGLTGVFLGIMSVDRHVHDTYFVVAHFHYVMVGSTVTAFMGGIHFWWPKMFGRMYPEFLARISAILVFVGFNLTFLPQFIVGYQGMPRRYHVYADEFQVYNMLSSAGATVMGAGYFLPGLYLLWSLKWGKKVSANPWGAKGLEWTIPSPPPTHNFLAPVVVTEEAYAYGEEDHAHAPAGAGTKEVPVVH
jgi:cytochrome c oxidase subunit 1